MSSDLWEKSLKILSLDDRIDSVVYDSILSRIRQIHLENGILVLAARDDFSLKIVKGNELSSIITEAVSVVNGSPVSVKFIKEGDENSLRTSVISERKVISNNNQIEVSRLSDEFTFNNFIVGDCNRFAHATAVSVANNPGTRQRNPFYIWGNSGLGKTHLMKAIGYAVQENFKNKRVLYTTCEEFTRAFVQCRMGADYDAFRNKYRSVDVLIIDDIQFLIGKNETINEFFNTFEALTSEGKQIIISSDKAPNNLIDFDSRLTSRFQNGILTDLQPPDFETRKAIFMSRMKSDAIELDEDIIDYVCENITSNVRELNGAYNTLSSYLSLSNGKIDIETTKNILSSMISPNKKKYITPEMIMNSVSRYYDISVEQMTSSKRNAEIATARSIAMYLIRDILDYTYDKIGKLFGGRKYSTVINSINNVDENEQLKKEAEEIKKRINE
ncbi:chromosomal replication initiator protein [Ruminococcaceae bacterium YRB3002]|nr:chromosomal replication initiator protein [Ruminococcaceae bacterium YRB3002]